MRVSARVEVNMQTRELAAMGAGFAQELADEMARQTAQLARRNVEPGSGPGPHPHRPGSEHIDTGDLRDSIQIRSEQRGFLKTGVVFTDLEYGLYLEMGWTNPFSGNHWRYPWLMPAMEEARQDWANVARSTGRRWFSSTGRPYAGRHGIGSPLSATWLPEVG